MVEKRKFIKVLACTCLFFCSSCANLDHINSYAHSSADGIDKFKEISFSFGDYCRHYQATPLTNTLQTDIAPLPIVDCKNFSNNDTTIKIFNRVLLAYLKGLEKLSAKDLVGYDLSSAATNLQTLQGKVVGLEITDAQVAATKNIATKLLDNFVNHYRKQKLKKIIQGSKDDFQKIIEADMTAMEALRDVAKSSLRNYKDFFSNPLLEMSKENALKTLLVRDYHQQEDVFAKIDQSIESYLKILKKIENGYMSLSGSSDKLIADDLKTALQQCVTDLAYLKAQMDDLKTTSN